MNIKRNIIRIAIAVVAVAALLVSPLGSVYCNADAYTSNVSWLSDGRYLYETNYTNQISTGTYYMYGGTSGISFSYYFDAELPGLSASTYKDGISINSYIPNGETETFTIEAGKMYKVFASLYGYRLSSGYPITFKDKGGSDFSGTLPLENRYCYFNDNNFKVTATPERAGYNFLGWFDDSDCTVPHVGLTGTLNSDPNLTVYALWEEAAAPDSYEQRLERLAEKITDTSKKVESGELKGTQTIYFGEGTSFPLFIMEALSNSNKNVTLDFTTEYNGTKYHFVIKGGKNAYISENIPWYGPYWLNQYYAVPVSK